jgi:hypothetical protein
MDQEQEKKLADLEAKIDAIYTSVEKTRRYFQIIFWGSIIMFVLPLVGLAFAIPAFLSSYNSLVGGLM